MREHHTPHLARVGFSLLGLIAAAAIFAPWLAPFDPGQRSGQPFGPPGGSHWLGTNDVGQDILSQLVYGARVSLVVGLTAAVVATLIGGVVGTVAGYSGGWLDAVLMRLVDATLALPFLPLVIVAGVFLGGGIGAQIGVISAVAWAVAARELRPQMMSLRRRADVEAAKVMGACTPYLLRRHLLPALAPLLPPQLVRAANLAILTEASLSFLGLGNASYPSWGNMLYYAQVRGAMLTDAWRWWVLPPGICIAATVISLALIGFALEERVHPSLAVAPPARLRRRKQDRGPNPAPDPLAAALDISGLCFGYPDPSGDPHRLVLNDVNLVVGRGEVVGLVGRSGSGKSTLASAVMGQIRPPGRLVSGTVQVAGCEINGLDEPARRALRGRVVALVPQDAMGALNPVMRVCDQLAEAVQLHRPVGRAEAIREAERLLEMVDIPVRRARAYPHQFSGGMRQRAVLAMALAHRPALLVADEPTTGLDPAVRERLLDLLERLHRDLGMAVLLISHDLEAAIRLAARVAVLDEGKVVEIGTPAGLVASAKHPATQRLLEARMPACATPTPSPSNSENRAAPTQVLRMDAIAKMFGRGRSAIKAVENVTMTIHAGEAVGLVGPSGAGKSTIARIASGLEVPDRGRILINGRDLAELDRGGRHRVPSGVHLVFQDPYEALPANFRVMDIVSEPLVIQGQESENERNVKARRALDDVALDPDRFGRRFPHELSGGERQRVAMARAVVGLPWLVIADEPAAMLDTVLAAEMAGLIGDLRRRYGMAWLLITHEMGLAARVCDRLVVMNEGRVQDEGPASARYAGGVLVAATEVRIDG